MKPTLTACLSLTRIGLRRGFSTAEGVMSVMAHTAVVLAHVAFTIVSAWLRAKPHFTSPIEVVNWAMGCFVAVLCWGMADLAIRPVNTKSGNSPGIGLEPLPGFPHHPLLWRPLFALIVWALFSVWFIAIAWGASGLLTLINAHLFTLPEGMALQPGLNAPIAALLSLPILALLTGLNALFPIALNTAERSLARTAVMSLCTLLGVALLFFLTIPAEFSELVVSLIARPTLVERMAHLLVWVAVFFAVVGGLETIMRLFRTRKAPTKLPAMFPSPPLPLVVCCLLVILIIPLLFAQWIKASELGTMQDMVVLFTALAIVAPLVISLSLLTSLVVNHRLFSSSLIHTLPVSKSALLEHAVKQALLWTTLCLLASFAAMLILHLKGALLFPGLPLLCTVLGFSVTESVLATGLVATLPIDPRGDARDVMVGWYTVAFLPHMALVIILLLAVGPALWMLLIPLLFALGHWRLYLALRETGDHDTAGGQPS